MLPLQFLPVQWLRANVPGPGKSTEGDARSVGFRRRVSGLMWQLCLSLEASNIPQEAANTAAVAPFLVAVQFSLLVNHLAFWFIKDNCT